MIRIGVDVGGTFTDLVVNLPDGRIEVFKVPSVPSDPSQGVLNAVESAAAGLQMPVKDLLGECGWFVHGSTIATNTVLERKGAKTGMLTTKGFRDSLEIRRGIRE
ncbi:MAG: hydantoinase/oxoprolinase N-terminal domain-containing protein, partial [Parvibaculaceae bacterium]